MKYLKLFEDYIQKYSIIKHDDAFDDLEEDDYDGLILIGETTNFLVYNNGSYAEFHFRNEEQQTKQIEELDTPIIMNLEHSNFNRVHINGISTSNLNKGYGKEIYSFMLEYTGTISSSFYSASEDAERVWLSLLREPHYYYAIVDDNFVIISKHIEKVRYFIKDKSYDKEIPLKTNIPAE